MNRMDDLISRRAAIEALGEEPLVWHDDDAEVAERNQWRRDVAAINALLPVQPERKKGRWISLDDFRGRYNEFGYKCSECGEQSDYEENYCPNCGVDMQTRDEGKECLETK